MIKKQPEVVIGKNGLLRKTFLKENCPNWYQCMLATGKLCYHLTEIDQQANERWETLIAQMARVEGGDRNSEGKRPDGMDSADEQYLKSC